MYMYYLSQDTPTLTYPDIPRELKQVRTHPIDQQSMQETHTHTQLQRANQT